MLTYSELMQEISAELPGPAHQIAARHSLRVRDVETALELLVRLGIARRVRYGDPLTGLSKTRWVLVRPIAEALHEAREQGIDVDGLVVSVRAAGNF